MPIKNQPKIFSYFLTVYGVRVYVCERKMWEVGIEVAMTEWALDRMNFSAWNASYPKISRSNKY